MGPDQLDNYGVIFTAHTGGLDAKMSAEDARELLERSGLPPSDLAGIWRLADVDGDGRLTAAEFACAMCLTAHRRRGVALPEKLPKELARLVGLPADAALWTVAPEQLAAYEALFDEVRLPGATSLETDDARLVLDRSGLERPELAHIWHLADADGDGRLRLGEFVVALHLAARCREGHALPAEVPAELLASAAAAEAGARTSAAAPAQHQAGGTAAAASEDWAVDAETLERYAAIWDGLDRADPTALSAEESREFLDRSGLGHEDLWQIWQLSDVNGDGRLSFGEFACAVHLVAHRLGGTALPAALPPVLRALARQLAPPHEGRYGDDATPDLSSWEVAPDRFQAYLEIFEGTERVERGFLSAEEGRELLERSGLPHEDLGHIWSLADVDGDGRLSPQEFACAMHLVSRRRSGASLPPALPPELTASVARAAGMAPPLADAGASLAPTTEELQRYRTLFDGLDARGSGRLGPEDVREVLERSGVEPADLAAILQMSDADQDGQLTEGEFACAIHLVSRRRGGARLPHELPPELRRLAAIGS